MEAQVFWNALKTRGLTFFSGVPDSTLHTAYNLMVHDPDIRYIPAVREDVALGVASAAYFTGQLGGVMMQNSGLGNLVNPLTSFREIAQLSLRKGSGRLGGESKGPTSLLTLEVEQTIEVYVKGTQVLSGKLYID